MPRLPIASSPAVSGDLYELLLTFAYLLMLSSTYFVLTVGLVLVSGCATGGKATIEKAPGASVPAAKPVPPPTAPSSRPSVARFTDGREGFVIKEGSGIDGGAREDFDHASALIKEGKYDKAIELLEKVIARSPGVAAPHINVALAYQEVKKPEQAEQHLKKALELIPGHPVASNAYGLLLRKAGRFAESRQVYERSLETFPEYLPIHRNLGILCDLYLKDAACAAKEYETYAKGKPGDAQVKTWLAELRGRTPSPP